MLFLCISILQQTYCLEVHSSLELTSCGLEGWMERLKMNVLHKVREPGATQPGVTAQLGRQLEMLGVSFLFLASFVTICSSRDRNPYSRESLIPSGAHRKLAWNLIRPPVLTALISGQSNTRGILCSGSIRWVSFLTGLLILALALQCG